ncbi:hypothetical protein CAPTEDRAFT_205864, partial [Capitella teleta]
MALVTVQRTPTPSNSPDTLSSSLVSILAQILGRGRKYALGDTENAFDPGELDDCLGDEADGLKPPSRSRSSPGKVEVPSLKLGQPMRHGHNSSVCCPTAQTGWALYVTLY